MNTSKSVIIRTAIARLMCLLTLLFLVLPVFSACSPTSTGIDEDDINIISIIYTPEKFEAYKDQWLTGKGNLFHKNENLGYGERTLVVGQEYYFVTFFDIDVNKKAVKEIESNLEGAKGVLSQDFEMDSLMKQFVTYRVLFSPALTNLSCIDTAFSCNLQEAETLITSGNEEEFSAYVNADGYVHIERLKQATDEPFRTYVAIPFTPLVSGEFDIATLFKDWAPIIETPTELYNGASYSFSVFDSDADVDNLQYVSVSNLRYTLMDEATYLAGDSAWCAAYDGDSYLHTGRNYLLVEFDVSADTAGKGDLNFLLFAAHEENFNDFKIEFANTSKTDIKDVDDYTCLTLSYVSPQKGTKHMTTVFSFEVNTTDPRTCWISFESGNMFVMGMAGDKLTFEFEPTS